MELMKAIIKGKLSKWKGQRQKIGGRNMSGRICCSMGQSLTVPLAPDPKIPTGSYPLSKGTPEAPQPGSLSLL